MRFWDREREKEWLKRYLQTEPNAILFVYGPKSSGKSTLMMRVVEELSRRKIFRKKYDVYWYDLRGKMIASYRDVVDLFFLAEDSKASEVIRGVEEELRIPMMRFMVKKEIKEEFYRKEADPFEYMEATLKASGRRSVVVFDELQKLKDVYVNSPNNQRPLVKELFNFFVRLTKVLHLAHVIVMTSDTFFIEEVYADSTLVNTSRFYLVDFFDDETAIKILVEEGLNEEEARRVVKEAGGVPWVMEEVVEEGAGVIGRIYDEVKGTVRETLGLMHDEGILEEVKGFLTRFLRGKEPDVIGGDRAVVRKLVERELMFYDPVSGKVRFQTRLHERAAREILGVG